MRTTKRMMLLATAALLLASGVWAQPSTEQPRVAHAHYGRDGFWHCDDGYSIGESGTCEALSNGWRRSAFTRLREFERADQEETALREQ